MIPRNRIFSVDDVLWQDDLALFRSLDGRVPWDARFGKGRVKVLDFDPRTQAGTYLFSWPPAYDPLEEHGHGSNTTELVPAGSLVQPGPALPPNPGAIIEAENSETTGLVQAERVMGPGTFIYLGQGERHGPFRAGPEGCSFLVHADGPLFDQAFIDGLMAHGKAARFRVDLADRPE